MNEAAEPETRSAPAKRRQSELLVMLRREGRLDVGPTAARLGVTQETLRRDLRAMEGEGLVRRSYGVAYPVESGRFETPFGAHTSLDVAEKTRIAEAAAGLIGTAQTIYVDEGHLPSLIVSYLSSIRPLTVITPSIPAAVEASDRSDLEIQLIGGRMRGLTLSTVEHEYSSGIDRMHIDIAFMSAQGISVENGLTTSDPALASVKSAAIRAARRRIFVGTHTTFGVTAFFRFSTVAEFDTIVTGSQFPAHRVSRYTQLGPQFVRA